ncbi:hypothetical protein XcfCFBP6991P_15580 [Xanthomonas citri pv. phaseoli var. fuscans]|nr:hypothetical protein XcfCFBP6991P_15580 [Xanthomonas citri pv. phaseoli var. fuscans]
MRRKDANHTAHDTSVAEFPAAVPVGSTQRMVPEDAHGHYAGEVPLAVLHADNVQLDAPLATMPSTAMRRCWPTPTSWRS